MADDIEAGRDREFEISRVPAVLRDGSRIQARKWHWLLFPGLALVIGSCGPAQQPTGKSTPAPASKAEPPTASEPAPDSKAEPPGASQPAPSVDGLRESF